MWHLYHSDLRLGFVWVYMILYVPFLIYLYGVYSSKVYTDAYKVPILRSGGLEYKADASINFYLEKIFRDIQALAFSQLFLSIAFLRAFVLSIAFCEPFSSA